jgi:succinate dehydrogenase or fumarate reductase, flavoprotein subunit
VTTTDSASAAQDFVAPASIVPGVTIGDVLDGHVPDCPTPVAWDEAMAHFNLVSPLNRRKFKIIVVGTGLAGSGAAAALGELGYDVQAFTYHDAPRRAHSIAAQGGVNSPRGRKVDNDSLYRFVKDTVKGGDYRCREADAYRLGQEGVRVIDHMDAIGAPFAREYGGTLATRSFGGVQVSRTYYTRGQTGQQLQLAGAQALQRQIHCGTVKLTTRAEVLDFIVKDNRCQGVVVRNLVTGEITAHTAHAVILATGGYGNVYFDSTLAKNSNASASWRAHQRGAYFASPSFVQFHPTGLPKNSYWQSKTILMSESLRNDGRIWVPKKEGDDRPGNEIPEEERDYFLERKYPAFGNLVPRDVASRALSREINAGRGVGPLHNAVYLDFRDAIQRFGKDTIAERYGNLFHMYKDATNEDPYEVPMRIAPTVHFTMGGLWSDYNMMTSIPGLFVGGECGWGYHGANRLGANSLLSACVDGWFTLPYTVPNYLAKLLNTPTLEQSDPAVQEALTRTQDRIDALMSINGNHGPEYFHRKLGEIMYKGVGVFRTVPDLMNALDSIRALRKEFWSDLNITGQEGDLNQVLERAGRVADYLELAELMAIDAADRDESCGAHVRDDHQTPEGEADRVDDKWCFVSAWESTGSEKGGERSFIRHAEPLTFDKVPLMTRNYKE